VCQVSPRLLDDTSPLVLISNICGVSRLFVPASVTIAVVTLASVHRGASFKILNTVCIRIGQGRIIFLGVRWGV
jgi:hypothetical protein